MIYKRAVYDKHSMTEPDFENVYICGFWSTIGRDGLFCAVEVTNVGMGRKGNVAKWMAFSLRDVINASNKGIGLPKYLRSLNDE